MRPAYQAASLGLLLLAALLTWLMLEGSDERDGHYFATQRTIDAIALVESRLQHDVLRARTGLLRSYGFVDALTSDLTASVTALKAKIGPDDPDVEGIADAVERERELVRRFRTGNQAVQDSIAYFDGLADRIATQGGDGRIGLAVAALQISVAEYARDATGNRAKAVQRRLDALSALPSAAHAEDVAEIARQVRALLALLPEVDDIVRSLPEMASTAARDRLAHARHVRREARQANADRYREALYLAAVVLLALLVRVGVRMMIATTVLRRTVELQSVLARASNLFLASQPDETAARILDVLELLGRGIRTDHAYLIEVGDVPVVHLWSRSGTPPPGWPQLQCAQVRGLDTDIGSDLVIIDVRDAVGPAGLRASLAARGAVAWSCARLRRGDRLVGFLCFERTSSPLPTWLRRSDGLLNLAGDIFSAALERQHTWRDRREMEFALQRAQRLEAIGTFTSGVAHNINNVLNVMLGHAEIAAETIPTGTRAARQIDFLMQAGNRAMEIADQILAFGRRGNSRHVACAIDPTITETISQIQASMAEPIQLTFGGGAGDARVRGEPAQLQQVAHNLVRNAAQASRPGDTVLVRLDLVRIANRRILSHGELAIGDYARLRVADRGIGMDEATQARIFEPFFTTRSAGTGLGLATAYEFVQEHGGAFDVRSALGRGSTFTVWLPVVEALDESRPSPISCGTLMVVGGTRAMIEEDEEALAALGFEPVGFADARSALAALRAAPARFDLLIVEARLVDMSCAEFCALAAGIARTPIVISLPASLGHPESPPRAPTVVDSVRRPWRMGVIASTASRYLAGTTAPTGTNALGRPIDEGGPPRVL